MIRKISLLLSILIISSCSSQVSESKAESLFKAHFNKEPYYSYSKNK